MADQFERDLALMLEAPSGLGGDDAFAAGVEARIERAWRLRRWGFGLAALMGAGVTLAVMARARVGLDALDQALAVMPASALHLQVGEAAWLLAAGLVAIAAVMLPRLLDES